MTMRFLVSANRHFRNMCVHGAVGEHKHDVGAAGTAVAPAFQFDCGQVWNKIGFPHVVARSYRDEVALAGEVFLLAGAVAEIEIAAEHERLIVEGVHHHRQVCGTDKQRPLGTATSTLEVPSGRCLSLSGMAKRLLAPHSKLRRLPSGNSSCVEPCPSST